MTSSCDSSTDYLDNAATTPLDPDVFEAMLPFLRGSFGNPSSVHGPGVAARRAIGEARERVAAAVSSRPARAVVFTSGGTEANNLAVRGFARSRRSDRIVTSGVEHPSVHQTARAAAEDHAVPHVVVRCDPGGRVDIDHLAACLGAKTTLVALVHGQNESGTLQPIVEAAAVIRDVAPRALLHVDAVQSFGKVSLDAVAAVADSIALSAHKIHGPKGAGALVLFTNARPAPLLCGGGQEDDVRSGTENVAGIVGFGVAAERAAAELPRTAARLARLADRVHAALASIEDARILGAGAPRLASIHAAAIAGVRGEVLQHHLERYGLVIGTGSACHAGKNRVSRTYEALGLDLDAARSVIRISLSRLTGDATVDRLVAALPAAVAELRALAR